MLPLAYQRVMKTRILTIILLFSALFVFSACASTESRGQKTEQSAQPSKETASINTLSSREKTDGWKLLFDGKEMTGWVGVGKKTFPVQGWKVMDGILIVNPVKGQQGGDIMTVAEYSDFELSMDFMLTRASNSGIKYFFSKYEKGGWLGLEYQLLDGAHPDAKLGRDGNRTVASLYDIKPASNDKVVNPLGSWNTAKIVAKGKHIEHWLNGKKVIEADRDSEAFKNLVIQSKYKDSVPAFGSPDKGHIMLQDHGDMVYFRNIKIRELK